MQEEDEYGPGNELPTFKVILIGNVGVGKTSILMRVSEDTFQESYNSTVGVDFKSKTFDVEGKKGNKMHVKIQIWDFSGSGKFAEIAKKRYEETHAVCFVFDSTAKDSFDEIDTHWIQQLKSYADQHQHTVKCLVANKVDLKERRVIEKSKAEQMAKSNDMTLFETSAKTSTNLEELFHHIATKLTHTFEENPSAPLFSKNKFVVDEEKKKKGCAVQ